MSDKRVRAKASGTQLGLAGGRLNEVAGESVISKKDLRRKKVFTTMVQRATFSSGLTRVASET